jgi:ribosomal protein S12 methylthiotransferase
MRSKKEKISVITLGCSKNSVDSERLLNQLKVNNFSLQTDPDKAETLIINTCGFIQAAKQESINTILNSVGLKHEGRIKKVFVAGCLSARYKEELEKEIPEVDAYFGTEDYNSILKALGGELKYNLLGERLLNSPSHSAYLKISEGCDHPCSFCAIPLMRGKHKSKPKEDLIKEAEFLAANNTKELVIIAQDTTDYGTDIYGRKMISDLLNDLSRINGIEWIRLMYAYPSKFPEDLIEVIADNKKICKYLDIPLQHISDNVLKSMRRGITSKRTKDLLFKLKTKIPDLTLRTTFITGYPNESEKDFEDLCEFVREIKFDRVGVFTFSEEENTASYLLGDPIPDEIKEERKNILMEIQKEISLEINNKMVGKKLDVLIENRENDFYAGRSYRDAPEVDGEVLIPEDGKEIKAGNFYSAEIYDCNEYDLFGRIVL